MMTITSVRTLDGKTIDLQVHSSKEQKIEAKGRLLLIPGLIDSHISLGNPKAKNWIFNIQSAVRGGITTLLDIPSDDSPGESKEELEKKKEAVDKKLSDLNMPLQYFPYVKSNSDYIEELGSLKGLTKGSLLVFTPEEYALEESLWERIFQIAAWEDIPIVINSHHENSWQNIRFKNSKETLLEKAIYYAERQNTRLYVLNVATQEELKLIQEGRSRSLLIYAETTAAHLFPEQPPQADFLWEALNSGAIETIGSGYHVGIKEDDRIFWQGSHFDFLNPIFLLPLLFTASEQGKIKLEQIVRLTSLNLYDIFKLEKKDENFVLIDLEKEQVIQRFDQMQSHELKLKGWPAYTVLKGNLMDILTFSSKESKESE